MSYVISPDSMSFEERLFPLFEHAAVGFAKVGLDCQWLRVNHKLCEMTGYSENELLGRTFCDITHPDDLDADLVNMQAVIAGDIPINMMEKRYLCKDGALLWVHLTATLVRDEKGQPAYFITVIEDISARKALEDRHDLVLRGCNDGIWDWNLETDEVYWNDRFYEIIGLSRETHPPNADLGWEIIHPDDRKMVQGEIQKHLKQGTPYELQFRVRHASGEYRTVLSRADSLCNEQGVPVRMAGAYRDITARVHAEEALKESEVRFRSLAEQAPVMIWMTDEHGGNIFSNKIWLEFVGHTQEENMGDGWVKPVHPDDRQAEYEKFLDAYRERVSYESLFRLKRNDGEYRWIRANGSPRFTMDGKLAGYIGICHDVTEKALAEQALQQSEARYRSIVETVYDGIWEWELKTNEVFWNDRLYEMHGYTKETFTPTYENFLELIHPDERATVQDALIQHLDSGVPFEMEMRKQHCNGEYRVFLVRGMALRDEHGIPYRMSGVNIDITERKLAENALKENEERFSLVIDSSNDGLYDWDLKRNESYWNDRYFEMLGYQPGEFEVSYEKYVELIHPDDRNRVNSAIQSYMQSPESYEIHYRMCHKDGHYLHVVCRGGTIFENGKPARLLGLVRDISAERQSREALEQSESRFRRVVDSDIIGIVFWNKQTGGITDANDAFLQMVGYTKEEMLSGQVNWREMTPPEYRHLDEKAFEQMDQHPKGKCEPYEKQYIAKDGRRIDILLAVAYYFGRKDSGVAFILNITERKQAERDLKESEARFRGLADTSPFMVWMTGPDGQINYHSKRTLEFTGLTLEETLAQNWLERVHPDERDLFVQHFFNTLQQQLPYEDEFRAMRQDGEYRWLLTMGVPRFNTQNQFLGYIGSTIDITERKIAELEKQASLEKERLLRRIMEIVSQSFHLDHVLDQIVEEVGQYFKADRCGLLRYTLQDGELIVKLSKQYSPVFPALKADEIPFKSLGFFKHNVLKYQEPDVLNIASMEDFARESRDYFEKYGLDAEHYVNGLEALFNQYSVKANLSIEIYYQGIPYGMIGLHQCTESRTWTDEDISLLRDIAVHVGVAFNQAELFLQEQEARRGLENYARKLEISNRELEQFSTIASHDLQEPLRKVQMFSQMVSENCNDEGRDYLERIQNATTRMQNLISDLLVLSRVNRKGQPFHKVDLNQCVQDALDDLEVSIRELSPVITWDPLSMIEADATQIKQLFLNLIGNALKFHKPGEAPNIHILGKRLADNHYEIVVEDQGIGFDDKYGERIFRPFERLHGHAAKYPGTGMGLCIVRKIVERHGGTIEAHGEEGVGARFIVTLPCQQGQCLNYYASIERSGF
jgi:PAS domain S-box-containing protein